MLKGDLIRATASGEAAVQEAPSVADRAWSQAFLAWVWSRAGQAPKAAEVLGAILPVLRTAGFLGPQCLAMLALGESYVSGGELRRGQELLSELVDVAERSGMKWFLGVAHRILGEVMAENRDDLANRHAVEHFDKSVAILESIGAENELALAWAAYGRLHGRSGRAAIARDYMSRALTMFDRLGTLTEPDRVRRDLVRLHAA